MKKRKIISGLLSIVLFVSLIISPAEIAFAADGDNGDWQWGMNVNDEVLWNSTDTLPDAKVGESYDVVFKVSEYTDLMPTYSMSFSSTGTYQNPEFTGGYSTLGDIELVGTPSHEGTYTLVVTAGDSYEYRKTYNLVVAPATTKEDVSISTDTQAYAFNNEQREFIITGDDSNLDDFVVEYLVDSKWTEVAPVNAGSYDITITRAEDSSYKAYAKTITNGLVIERADYDMSSISFEDNSFTYDGASHSLSIDGSLPNGVSVSYSSNNGLTNVGEATVTATFATTDSNYNAPAEMTATLSVTKAQAVITVDTTAISKTYGEEVTLPIATTNFGQVTCDKTSSDIVNAGTYQVTYSVEETSNYYGDTKTLMVEIVKADYDMSGVCFENGSFAYDGKAHSLSITGTLPDNVSVSYSSNNTLTDPGEITVTATFTTDDPNYNTPDELTAVLKVTKSTADKTVNTGDAQNPFFWGVSALIALILGLGAVILKKRNF